MALKSIGCVYSFSHDNHLLIYRTFLRSGCCIFTAKHDIWYGTYVLACENIRFSSLFAAGDVSRGGISNKIVNICGI